MDVYLKSSSHNSGCLPQLLVFSVCLPQRLALATVDVYLKSSSGLSGCLPLMSTTFTYPTASSSYSVCVLLPPAWAINLLPSALNILQ